MGRGLSTQQRAILALARAFNAATRDGVPAPQEFTYHVRPGDTFPVQPDRIAVAEVAWAPVVPDYHDNFGLWVLHGFRPSFQDTEEAWWNLEWKASTVCRSRKVSMARAVDGLLERGMLCHAMYPGFVSDSCTTDGVVNGYGRWEGAMRMLDRASVEEMASEPLRKFWTREYDSWPSYWLTVAGHDVVAGDTVSYDAAMLVAAHAASRKVGRRGVGRHAWWKEATPEAADRREAELGLLAANLRAAIATS